MQPSSPRRNSIAAALRRHRFQVVVVVIAVLLAEVAHRSNALGTAEHLYSDLWHRLSGARLTPQHVALVVVDDTSLAQHADDPLVFWTPHFARAAATLRALGASVVGIDFFFAVTPEGWISKLNLSGTEALRDYDLAFRQELNTGQSVLAASLVRGDPGGHDGLMLPHSDYLLSLPSTDFSSYVGFADLPSDADGGVRRYEVTPAANLPSDLKDGAPRFALGALVAARAAGADLSAATWQLGGRTISTSQIASITYAGPPGTISRISLSRVLAPDALQDPGLQALRGKAVLIGGDFQGMNDVHSTPYSGRLLTGSGALMSGVEIQANVVETLLSGRSTEQVSTRVRWMLLAALIVLTTGAYHRWSPWSGLIVLTAACALTLAIGFAAFQRFRLVPVASLQLGLVAAYLVAYSERLTTEQRDKARVKKLFKGYVSDDVVDMLLSAEYRPDLRGEMAHITVLFSDIRKFTTISEKLSAHETVEFLNAYFAKVVTIVKEEGGRIDKFIGDAVMAEFGVPYRFPDHAHRALRAAVRMRTLAVEFAAWMRGRFPDRDLPPFAIGVGVHSGNAVVGNIGSEMRMEYTAIGDVVNVASRLEGTTKDLHCVIVASAAVVRTAGDKVETGMTATIELTGRREPVEVYEIIDVRP